MKIAVIGVGGVGGYFGARFLQAGFDVYFYSSSRSRDSLEKNGIKLISPLGDVSFTSINVRSFSDPEQCDIIFVCLKSFQYNEVAPLLDLLLARNSVIIPLSNGIDPYLILSKETYQRQLIPGLCKIISERKETGVIHHYGFPPSIQYGEPGIPQDKSDIYCRMAPLHEATGYEMHYSEWVMNEVWKKFIFVSAFSSIAIAYNVNASELLEDSKLISTCNSVIEEGRILAEHFGVRLNQTDIDEIWAIFHRLPPKAEPSLKRDFRAGVNTELETQIGAFVRYAELHGLNLETSKRIYAQIMCAIPDHP